MRDRALLDEEQTPKKALCFESKHNQELARAFPAREVLAVGKSYAATVAALGECGALVSALQRYAR